MTVPDHLKHAPVWPGRMGARSLGRGHSVGRTDLPIR